MRDIRLNLTCILATETIEAAFERLNANRRGILFATDSDSHILGCVTDGDIRRQLLKRSDLTTPISEFMNRDFVRAYTNTPREHVLKLLDHRVHIVPILDSDGRLVRISSRDEFLLQDEAEVFARARAPARISFGGGGSDLTHYFFEEGGMVINTTITKYAHALLRRRHDDTIIIYSHDLKSGIEAQGLDALQFDGQLDLIKAVVKLIAPVHGFELETATDFPLGSGLGGSASLAAAIIGCFNEFRSSPWDRHQIAEMAFQSERLNLNIPGGWQDQYAAVFGGFNYMEFSAGDNVIIPLRLERRILHELEASIILCHTGKSHNSGAIHTSQREHVNSSETARAAIQRQKEISAEMKRRLLRGELKGYGTLLHEAWLVKQKMSPLISDPEMNGVYEHAIRSGALGGKLLGAGGGGYFMFFAPSFELYRVIAALADIGYQSERVVFDDHGLVSWKMPLTS